MIRFAGWLESLCHDHSPPFVSQNQYPQSVQSGWFFWWWSPSASTPASWWSNLSLVSLSTTPALGISFECCKSKAGRDQPLGPIDCLSPSDIANLSIEEVHTRFQVSTCQYLGSEKHHASSPLVGVIVPKIQNRSLWLANLTVDFVFEKPTCDALELCIFLGLYFTAVLWPSRFQSSETQNLRPMKKTKPNHAGYMII